MASASQTAAIIMKGSDNLASRILALSPVIFWPLDETSGTNADNAVTTDGTGDGTYSGPTLAQYELSGISYPSFDGVNDFVNVYSAHLNTVFVPTVGSFALWAYPTTAAMTDATQRYGINIGADANNRVYFDKTTVDNQFQLFYAAGATFKGISFTSTGGNEWKHMAITWDTAAGASGEVKVYLNGVQQGTTQVALGTWVGALGSTACAIGALSSTPTIPWLGGLAIPAIWNRVLTASEIAGLVA